MIQKILDFYFLIIIIYYILFCYFDIIIIIFYEIIIIIVILSYICYDFVFHIFKLSRNIFYDFRM